MITFPIGYVFIGTGLLAFAGMGVIHKIGERLQGDPLTIAFFTVLSGGVLSAASSFAAGTLSFHTLAPAILLVGLPFGVCTGLALWLFQAGLRYGHIATSWLLINLSAGVPTLLSIVIYREQLGTRQTVALILIVISLVLLWWDRRNSSPNQSGA